MKILRNANRCPIFVAELSLSPTGSWGIQQTDGFRGQRAWGVTLIEKMSSYRLPCNILRVDFMFIRRGACPR